MNVYKFKLINASYGGGEAIVAANSIYEAYGVLCHTDKVASNYFDPSNCECIPSLTCDTEQPLVISLEYYVE